MSAIEFDNDEKKLYKSSEVAEMLNISTQTLKNHWKNGMITAIVISTHRYYTKQAILEYLENGTAKAKQLVENMCKK